MEKTSKVLLKAVLSLPTMSFHETAIATFVRWYAMGLGLKVREDSVGNLLVEYRGGKGGVTFAAHMDHPGFEVISSHRSQATVVLWGKVKPETFAGSKVITYTKSGPVKGVISRKILDTKHLGRFCFTLNARDAVAPGDFGHYDLPAFQINGDRIITRAADNLISVVAILELMTNLVATKPIVNVSGLFTRAEEAGFLGAFAAMESRFIPKNDPLIVLECSSAAGGGVDIGEGPVVRAGDLQSTYDPAVDVWLSDIAASLLPSHGFRYQRALLQGGRCEACVYVAQGYHTGGIALPLGNYHNQGPRGAAAEYVSVKDYENLITLLTKVALAPMPANLLRTKVKALWKNYHELKSKLRPNL